MFKNKTGILLLVLIVLVGTCVVLLSFSLICGVPLSIKGPLPISIEDEGLEKLVTQISGVMGHSSAETGCVALLSESTMLRHSINSCCCF